jgi:uncharacterized membrane protein SpoIIM required for sporulation
MAETGTIRRHARMLPQTVALMIIGLAGLALSTSFVVAASNITNRTWDEPGDEGSLTTLAALTDVTFFIGVAALVGAIVLAGVTELFRRYAGTATASDT